MKLNTTPQPPRWATRFLSWYCRPELLEDLEGDLNEYFDRNVRSRGLRRARLIYIADVLKFMRIYMLRKPRVLNPLISWIMIGSYLKTTRRNMVRNKLFSFINIFGLSVSMSVGLLVIAFATDVMHYDDFHEKKDRIYRVSSLDFRKGQPTMDLASTSVLAGKEIAASVSGVETLSLMRAGWGYEATAGGGLVPLSWLWADQNFFRIFSFTLLEGNPATALKDPYAVVITQKAATKLFGTERAMGKPVRIGAEEYIVTGVLRDVPKLSHLRFEVLGSFATVELTRNKVEENFMSWENPYMNFVYVLLNKDAGVASVQAGLDRLSAAHNAPLEDRRITLALQPLKKIVISTYQGNPLGPGMPVKVVWMLGGLAFVVIISACFNYTNLSIARALRRSREVGIRKVVGANRRQVVIQFVMEAVVIAVLALGFSLILFFFLRRQFVLLDPYLDNLLSLELSADLILYFLIFALSTGIVAGVVPALLFSRIQAVHALKDLSGLRFLRGVNLRKSLIVVQYVFSLVFITATVIGYNQYKSFLTRDLGFATKNILNIKLTYSDGARFADELRKLPAVTDVSRSYMVTNLGNISPVRVKYKDPQLVVNMQENLVDEHYLPVHGHRLIAGRSFHWKPDSARGSEILVNEELLKRFNMAPGNPMKALGEELILDDVRATIVGVLKDFHYGTASDKIEPTILRYQPRTYYNYVNVKIDTKDLPAAMASIEALWRTEDRLHPMNARFYDDQIGEAYALYAIMVRIIGALAFLAICIASLGLFGMVVFITETKLKEISIRKVLGATEGNLVVLLSRGFLLLLVVAAVIALPATYLFFDKIVLVNIVYHAPIGWMDMSLGLIGVLVIAALMIGSHTLKVARANPATTLKNE